MAVEQRVARLEEALARFIEQSNEMMAASRQEIAAIREEVAEFRASTHEHTAAIREEVAEFRASIQQHVAAIHEEVAEIRASNAHTDRQLLQMQQQAEKDRKDFNKRLAEISDSMGTLIEDMVAPCGFKLAQAIFDDQETETCGIRLKARHPANPAEMMELDLLAVGPSKVLVVEVKRRLDAAKAEEYRQKLQRLPEFFPALAGKTICAAVASVYLEPLLVAFLNRQELYGIAIGDEVMEVVNLGQF